MTNIQKCMPMTDHFEGIDKLVKEAPHTDGAPNFRRVSESWSQMGGNCTARHPGTMTLD